MKTAIGGLCAGVLGLAGLMALGIVLSFAPTLLVLTNAAMWGIGWLGFRWSERK